MPDSQRWALVLTVYSNYENNAPALTTVYGFGSEKVADAAGERWAASITSNHLQATYTAVCLDG